MSTEVIVSLINGVVGLVIAMIALKTHRTVVISHEEHKEHEAATRRILEALNGEAEK